MSNTYIPVALRREVVDRANGCCEYCLSNSDFHGINFAVDHVIAEKHRGKTISDNLCYSCYWCNSFKGSDISSVLWEDEPKIIPLFHPRKQKWNEHFRLENETVIGVTPTGKVTVDLLQMNANERKEVRQLMIEANVYPCKTNKPDQ